MSNQIQIQGIKFFDNAPSCLSSYKEKHWIKKALRSIQNYGTLLVCAADRTWQILNGSKAKMAHYTKVPTQSFSKQKLVVCIHGLNTNPLQFKKIIDKMPKDQTNTDIYIPHVFQKGNAKLDQMVEPIFQEIEKWAKSSGGDKELVLVGISNGGRIARALEAKLGHWENIKKFGFISIVGACKGSSLANLAHKMHLSWLMSKNIREEMPLNSPCNLQLDREWEENLKKTSSWVRSYTFIASRHDWQVPNYDSTLMKIPDNQSKTRYAIIPGHGHISTPNAAAKAVAEIISQSI